MIERTSATGTPWKVTEEIDRQHLSGKWVVVLAEYRDDNGHEVDWHIMIAGGQDGAKILLGAGPNKSSGWRIGWATPITELFTRTAVAPLKVGSALDWAVWKGINYDLPGVKYVQQRVAEMVRNRMADPRTVAGLDPIEAGFLRAEAMTQVMSALHHPFAEFSPNDNTNPVPPGDIPYWHIPEPIIDPNPTAATMATPTLAAAFRTMGGSPEQMGKWTGKNVMVGVIDTGINLNHPAFAGRRIKAVDATGTRPSGADDNGHGTWCCGAIVGGRADAPDGEFRGWAPDCALLSVKVLVAAGWGTDEMISRGIDICVAAGCRIISASIGGSGVMPQTANSIARAIERGVIFVAAAGNSGPADPSDEYPGKLPGVITCAAVTTDAPPKVASFSSRGPSLDVAACGVNVPGPDLQGGYSFLSGTSMATPQVAGALAAMLGAEITNDPAGVSPTDDTVTAMLATCKQLPGYPTPSRQTGRGVLQFDAAIAKLTPPVSPPPPPPPPPTGDVFKIDRDEMEGSRDCSNFLMVVMNILKEKGTVTITLEG